MSLTQWVKFKQIFCAQILNQSIFFSLSLWAKPTKAWGKQSIGKGFKGGLPSNSYIYTYLFIYLFGAQSCCAPSTWNCNYHFIQWQHHWRYFNLKDGTFACKWRKVPNTLHAKICFQQKKQKTLKCFIWRSHITIPWTNFLHVFVSALHNTIYPLTLAFASILQIYKCVKGGRFKLSPFF
jgi:hypothetical protein